MYVKVSEYLDWITEIKRRDVVADYNESAKLPYEKMDNGIFVAMFDHLSKIENNSYRRC